MKVDSHKILVERRNALQSALAKDIYFLRNTPDTEDESALCAAQMETNELRRINAALGKISDGTYGLCEDCGKAIPKARLEALPHATRCLRCQWESEGHRTVEEEPNWQRLSEEDDD